MTMSPLLRGVSVGISIFVTRALFQPVAADASSFQLSDAAARALERQAETSLSHGIDAVGTTVFNRRQTARLVQELEAAARGADDRTRINLEEAGSFIEDQMTGLGSSADRYVVLIGD